MYYYNVMCVQLRIKASIKNTIFKKNYYRIGHRSIMLVIEQENEFHEVFLLEVTPMRL